MRTKEQIQLIKVHKSEDSPKQLQLQNSPIMSQQMTKQIRKEKAKKTNSKRTKKELQRLNKPMLRLSIQDHSYEKITEEIREAANSLLGLRKVQSDRARSNKKLLDSFEDSQNFNDSTHCYSSVSNITASPHDDEKEIEEDVSQISPISNNNRPQPDTFDVKPIFFLDRVPSTQKILRGEQVIFKDHYKEILRYYDIIPVPTSFIEGVTLPSQGLFFEVKPQVPDFWTRMTIDHPNMANFINRFTSSN
ncbi:UNKNOWN [Stylonychia lemnae]|uniref:Uncharacterized protein n=1 Tax=Stylonychia lemnae TaxID=5949 RepID=A0A078A331_STYLE|nr:UNKNOWN [Stylonychia lemnae]|eukprot:CDW75174.1 UNKNOWN [Stylonychia lemnae]